VSLPKNGGSPKMGPQFRRWRAAQNFWRAPLVKKRGNHQRLLLKKREKGGPFFGALKTVPGTKLGGTKNRPPKNGKNWVKKKRGLV